ncbi:MAG: hypothetical protein A3E78_07870 [Alphaproteobacteria bacterium RIFCSPHIGHO2_12_FULL_63_12]|nr:MAG: hypothetical protein A3E78_07870 [Alphaproteobacteria bacterium RIFCSPHIGHO2_12_FULL_63_12]
MLFLERESIDQQAGGARAGAAATGVEKIRSAMARTIVGATVKSGRAMLTVSNEGSSEADPARHAAQEVGV